MAKAASAKKVTTSKTKKLEPKKNVKTLKASSKSASVKSTSKKVSKVSDTKSKKQIASASKKIAASKVKDVKKVQTKSAKTEDLKVKSTKLNIKAKDTNIQAKSQVKDNFKGSNVQLNKSLKSSKQDKVINVSSKNTSSKVVEKQEVEKITSAIKPNNDSTLSYTQLEFYDNIKAFCGLEKRAQAKEICDDITNFILDALSKGYKVPFLGLGKLYVRKTKARIGRNPTTGEIVHIKAKSRVRFAPAKSLVDFSD